VTLTNRKWSYKLPFKKSLSTTGAKGASNMIDLTFNCAVMMSEMFFFSAHCLRPDSSHPSALANNLRGKRKRKEKM
jgi:hypothetical protein